MWSGAKILDWWWAGLLGERLCDLGWLESGLLLGV